ncbi:MAG: TIGR01777 family oxidoreductase [Solirubrobacterales bacterium]
MRVLITGASGLIGSAVADALLARGNEVVALSRDPARVRTTNPTATWHQWEPTTERPPAEAFAGVEAVVNLIGEEINQRLTPEAKRSIRDSRVRATRNLVDGMTSVDGGGPKVLVSQAAVGYYADHGDAIVDESTAAGPEWLSQLVVEWEEQARGAEASGVRVAILRTGLYLDPDGGLLKQLLPVFKLGVGGPLSSGRQYMPWIHRDDEVGLILWALENPEVTGTLNASAPNPVTNREFSKQLGRVLRRPSLIPAPKLAVAALRGHELTDSILASLRVVPRRALDLGYGFRWPELEPALRDLLR